MTIALVFYGYMALMLAAAILHRLRQRNITPPRRTPSSQTQAKEPASCQRPK